MNPSLLIILTGKTAAGKDTLAQKLLAHFPTFKKIITTTSRPKRGGEVEGIDYHFLTKFKFNRKIENGDFAEYVEYGGNLYGTQKKELEETLRFDTLWRIDPSRAGEVREFIKRSLPPQVAKELIKKVLVIYITVSDNVILQRLQMRGLSQKEIEKRMDDDAKIWRQFKNKYDFVVENTPGNLNETVDKIRKIVENRLPTAHEII